jgi:hypothetical protein
MISPTMTCSRAGRFSIRYDVRGIIMINVSIRNAILCREYCSMCVLCDAPTHIVYMYVKLATSHWRRLLAYTCTCESWYIQVCTAIYSIHVIDMVTMCGNMGNDTSDLYTSMYRDSSTTSHLTMHDLIIVRRNSHKEITTDFSSNYYYYYYVSLALYKLV